VDYWTRGRLLAAQPLREWKPPGSPPPTPTVTPTAHTPTRPAPRVGALFEHSASGNHFCTASVVASPGHDLLMTAAHCINGGKGGYRQDIVFIPGYHDGDAPYGVWTPAKLLVDPRWASSSDPDYDVGFVVLAPNDGKNVEDVLGANKIGFDAGYSHLVRVTGYPSSADAPVTCRNWTYRQSASQLKFECGGFFGGTSGSPWITDFDPRTGTGTIVGVIGGYQAGGDTDSISYSVYLGGDIRKLYEQAKALG
jgi:V8-like Glu-specific endopeptidase